MYVIFLIVRNNFTDGFKDIIMINYKHTKENQYPINTKQQVDYAIKLLKQNKQITIELSKQIKKKYKDFNVTPQC